MRVSFECELILTEEAGQGFPSSLESRPALGVFCKRRPHDLVNDLELAHSEVRMHRDNPLSVITSQREKRVRLKPQRCRVDLIQYALPLRDGAVNVHSFLPASRGNSCGHSVTGILNMSPEMLSP
jgi:hypothetical protein